MGYLFNNMPNYSTSFSPFLRHADELRFQGQNILFRSKFILNLSRHLLSFSVLQFSSLAEISTSLQTFDDGLLFWINVSSSAFGRKNGFVFTICIGWAEEQI